MPAAAAAPCRALESPSGHGAWIWLLLLQVVQDLSGFVSWCCSAVRFLGVQKDSGHAPTDRFGDLLWCIFWEKYGLTSAGLGWPRCSLETKGDCTRGNHAGSLRCLCCSTRWFHLTEPGNARLEETACCFWELDAPWHVWREGSGIPACQSCSFQRSCLMMDSPQCELLCASVV